jgi:hypothetical protein
MLLMSQRPADGSTDMRHDFLADVTSTPSALGFNSTSCPASEIAQM